MQMNNVFKPDRHHRTIALWTMCVATLLVTAPIATAQSAANPTSAANKDTAKTDQPGTLRFAESRAPKPPQERRAPSRPRGNTTAAKKAQKGRSRAATKSRTQPRTPPRTRPTPRPGSRKPPVRKGEPVVSRVNLDAEDIGKPAEERSYTFSIVDGTYKDLIENFGRMAGVPVLGEAPVGTVSFVSTEKMDFKSALTRVRLLLFKFSPIEPYWLTYKDNHLEVIRVTDVWRDITPDHLFMDLASFKASNIPDNELAMLLYTPADTSVAQYTILRDFMPDYVRIAPLENSNSLAIFALVSDIKKYLELIRLFEGAVDDPRVLQKLAVKHLPPSQVVDTLRLLMDDLGETGKPRPRNPRGGANAAVDLPGQRTVMFPDDAQRVIVVRAVPKKIAKIKAMLEFIDVDLGGDFEPVLIPIQHIAVEDLLVTIQPLIAKSAAPTVKRATPKRRKGKKPVRGVPAAVTTDKLVMIPVRRTNTLVLVGAEEQVDHVRRLIDLFDVPLEDGGPEFVEIKHATLTRIANTLPPIVKAYAQGGAGAEDFEVLLEPTSNSVILVGHKRDIATAKDLIKMLDIEGDEVTLHSYKFFDASPTTAMDLITLLDSQGGGALAGRSTRKGGKKQVRRATKAASSNIHVEEAEKSIYILCTEKDWNEKYVPLLKRLDEQAAQPAPIARIDLTYLSPEEAINVLTPLVIVGKAKNAAGMVRFAPAEHAIIVTGVTPAKIDYIRDLVAELDHESEGLQRRVFEIVHVEPSEIERILKSGVVGKGSPPRTRATKGKLATHGIVVTAIGSALVVSAPPEDMKDVADLIAQLDVEGADNTVIRVYSIPRGLDVQDIASLLESLISGLPKTTRKPPAAAVRGGVRIVAQGISRKLLVSAPIERFPKIEKTLELLLEGESPEGFKVRFFPVKNADADAIASLIEPILQIREKELRSMGTVPAAGNANQRANPMRASMISVSPDIQMERIMVSAPESILAEAQALIEQLDRPGSRGDRILRVITLSRSTPDEIVAAVGVMLSGAAKGPVHARPRVKKPGTPTRRSASQITDDVVVTAAPGGGAIIISGYPDEVDRVERWVRQLDDDATPEKTLKIYRIANGDIDQIAESIIALCDVPTAAQKAQKRIKSEDSDLLDAKSDIRSGSEITLSLDQFNKIIIARATPAKIFEIDAVIDLYEGKNGEDPAIPAPGVIPFLIYELQNTDAFDASISLSSLLSTLWPFGNDTPPVDYISGTNQLVVKCLPEHNAFVTDLIQKYVDKESAKVTKVKRVFKTISGLTPSAVAAMLKMRMPDVNVQLSQIGEEIPSVEQLHPYKPCALPSSLLHVLSQATTGAIGQQAPQQENKNSDDTTGQSEHERAAREAMESIAGASDQPKPSDADADDDVDTQKEQGDTEKKEPEPSTPLIVRFDDRAGVVVIEGSPRDVDEVEETLDEILDEVESMSTKPDIRIFRIKYRDVNVAANILETMFGAVRAQQPRGGGAAAQQQLRRMQQQMQQQMQRQMQQMARQQNQQPAPPTPAIDPRTGLPLKEGGDEPKKKNGVQMRIHPDPQTRTIIVRASTEDFPIIVELLATIDRPPDVTNEHRIFKLTRLRAADVEQQIKILLGIQKTSGRSAPVRRPTGRRGARGGQPNPAMQQIEDALLNLNLGAAGQGAINASSDITITSNEQANTLLVMAPKAAIDLVAKLIEELESQEIPVLETRTYALKHAAVTDAASRLREVFGGARAGKKSAVQFDPNAVNQASFIAEERTNTLIVRALDTDFDKIEPLIEQLDQDLGDQEVVVPFTLANADATQVAKTLDQAYGSGGRGKSGKTIKFVGDAASNTLFVTAPEHLRAEIAKRIADIDTIAGGLRKPRVIKLAAGSAESIAKKLQEVFRGKGRKSDRVAITGDNASKQVFVTAPDNLFTEIQEYVRSMDLPSTNIDIRSFPLQHANATEVHENLMTMVRQAAQQIKDKSAMDVFTATADERTNSIVVLGGPTSFMLVEKALRQIDIAPTDQSQIVTAIYHLINADATELARNIKSVYGKKRRKGVEAPTAEANRSNNILIVRGTKKQTDEIYEQMIQPVEDQSGGGGRTREILSLEFAEAADVARIINEEINKGKPKQKSDGRQPITVIANESLNSLIVSGSADDVKEFSELARSLDKEPASVSERVTRVYDVKFADPNSLVTTLKNMFRKQRGQRPEESVEVGYDWGTSKLVVTALPKNLEIVETALEQIDVESTTIRSERVVKLGYANAQELARNLQNMFRQNIRGKRGEQAMTIFADVATNSLIVYANDPEFERVDSIVKALDIKPEESRDRQMKSFTLSNTNPWTVSDAIRQIYKPKGRQANPRDQVIALAEGTSMSVIVSASPEKMLEIEKLVAEFDKPARSDSNVHVVEIKHADAGAVTQALQQIFVQSGGRNVRGQATIQISNPRGSSMVVVKANDQMFDRVVATINELDTASAQSDQIEVIALQHSEADKMQEMIENFLRKSGQGRRGAELAGDIRISANSSNNTLVIAGDAEEVAKLKATIAKIDVEVEGAGNAPQIIQLQHARASQIEPMLTQMFIEGGQRRGGRRGKSSASSMPPVIAADEQSNTLIVRASPADFGMIEDLITKLDTDTQDEKSFVQLIPMAEGINVTDLAQLVEETVNRHEQIRAEQFPGMNAGSVVINPDPRTNVLVVAGTPTLFPEVERLAKSLEKMGPTGRLSVRRIKLKSKTPQEVSQLLERIIQENVQSKSGSKKVKGRRGTTRRKPNRRSTSKRRPPSKKRKR